MKKLALLAVLFAGGLWASGLSPCAQNTVAFYLSNPCLAGNLSVTNFQFAETGTASLLSTSQILVTPMAISGSFASLSFAPMSGMPFTVGPLQNAKYFFAYFLDPPPPMIEADEIDLLPSDPTTLTATLCPNAQAIISAGIFCSPSVPPVILTVNSSGPSSAAATFATPLAGLGVGLELDVTDTNGTGAFSNGFASVGAIPEPSTGALAFLGLFLVCLASIRPTLRRLFER